MNKAETPQGTPADDGTGAAAEPKPPRIEIEVTVAELTEEQKSRFGDYVEFWDAASCQLFTESRLRGSTRPPSPRL